MRVCAVCQRLVCVCLSFRRNSADAICASFALKTGADRGKGKADCIWLHFIGCRSFAVRLDRKADLSVSVLFLY